MQMQGRVHSTGKGSFGRLGRGGIAAWSDELDFHEVEYFRKTTDSILNPGEEPVIVKVDAGREFSAAMSAHGEIWVWGRNDYGQLGMGVEVMHKPDFCMHYPFLLRNMPMEGHALRDFACGDHHIVALTSAGAIYEWGDRHHFEPTAITLPSRYQEGLKGIWKVAAGESCSFALSMDGSLYSWGRKSSGCLALGDSCEEWVKRPVQIPPEKFGNQRVVDIIASKHHCMAITEKV
ncbi:HERC1 [Symbiodinium necroappetens]|uniref:HERC1 protein n=1 Tax=Symbiodinium necroappetens TaxID=1628268 RepID=A0A812NTH7_9DINO|nr:HERC1 [Symbiodinium necroappetens]